MAYSGITTYTCYRKPTATLFVGAVVILLACYVIISLLSHIIIGRYHIMYLDRDEEPYPQDPSSLTPKKQILLVTYGRSGSSFTSALINHHKDVFYVFEPLFILKNRVDNIDKRNDSVGIVNAYLSCYFPYEYIYALENSLLYHSSSMKDFYTCIHAKAKGVFHLTCFLDMVRSCRSHEFSFVKTIRFRVTWAETYLESNPNFKLLYLVRDPRATLFSQSRVFRTFNWKNDIQNISRQHCSLLEDDLMEAERLKKRFPDRVKGIRYEHGAMDSLSYTKEIYRFLGLTLSDDLVRFVENITSASRDNPNIDNAYSILRHNASQAMDRWRYGAGYTSVSEVDGICGHLYSKLGYMTVHSQSDLESGRSLVGIPDPGGIFY